MIRLIFVLLGAGQLALHVQDFTIFNREVQVHGWISQGFLYTNQDNWLTTNSKTRGAIGYVSGQTSAEGVKTVDVVDAANGGERRLTTRVEPVYPRELKARSIGGTVRLKITILPTGGVTNVRLLGGNPILGESAIRAVQAWKYAPASFRTTTEVEIPFNPR